MAYLVRVPEGTARVGVDGQEFAVSADGTITLPDGLLPALAHCTDMTVLEHSADDAKKPDTKAKA